MSYKIYSQTPVIVSEKTSLRIFVRKAGCRPCASSKVTNFMVLQEWRLAGEVSTDMWCMGNSMTELHDLVMNMNGMKTLPLWTRSMRCYAHMASNWDSAEGIIYEGTFQDKIWLSLKLNMDWSYVLCVYGFANDLSLNLVWIAMRYHNITDLHILFVAWDLHIFVSAGKDIAAKLKPISGDGGRNTPTTSWTCSQGPLVSGWTLRVCVYPGACCLCFVRSFYVLSLVRCWWNGHRGMLLFIVLTLSGMVSKFGSQEDYFIGLLTWL